MKKVITSVLVAMTLMGAGAVRAEQVPVDQAQRVAAIYLRQNTNLSRLTADQLTLTHQWYNAELNVPSMYLFSAPEAGWIIIAACTATEPVVAFSDDNVFDVSNVPPQADWWLRGYNELVSGVQTADAEKALEENPEWADILASEQSAPAPKAMVKLLNTTWNQGDERGIDYNMLAPVVNDSVCPTGCVATALAQICKYYAYPKKATGRLFYTWYYRENGVTKSKQLGARFDDSAAFNYDTMPNSITVTWNGNTNVNYARRYEVSRLGYYLGLAVKMSFSPDGSGSNNNNAIEGMATNFKYSRGQILTRTGSADTHFVNTIRRELMMKRPLYMTGSSRTGSGRDAAGHAWVCDGYNTANETHYHMNWGWGGSSDGYFNLSTLANNNMSAGGYDFVRDQQIIYNMLPPADSTDRPIYVGVSEVADGTSRLGAAYPNPATLSITLPYATRQAAELKVYSIDGRLVESRPVQAGEGEVVLPVAALPSGIYIYRMGDAHGKFIVR